MSKTQSHQILPIFLPKGWESIKVALKKSALNQQDPEMRTISGLARILIARGLNFNPEKVEDVVDAEKAEPDPIADPITVVTNEQLL